MPSGSALVVTTAMVWGWQSASTKKPVRFERPIRRNIVIASAAAVASSSIDAFAISQPVRSATMVWKVSSISSRPWLISGWYGVYEVYQAGFSTMLRRITGGVMQSFQPMPSSDRKTSFRSASSRSLARASCSVIAGGSRSSASWIESGTARSSRLLAEV